MRTCKVRDVRGGVRTAVVVKMLASLSLAALVLSGCTWRQWSVGLNGLRYETDRMTVTGTVLNHPNGDTELSASVAAKAETIRQVRVQTTYPNDRTALVSVVIPAVTPVATPVVVEK